MTNPKTSYKISIKSGYNSRGYDWNAITEQLLQLMEQKYG